MIAFAVCVSAAGARAQIENLPRPIKRYSVEGRVSMPDDRPATRARVKLSIQADITRECVTNDTAGSSSQTSLPASTH